MFRTIPVKIARCLSSGLLGGVAVAMLVGCGGMGSPSVSAFSSAKTPLSNAKREVFAEADANNTGAVIVGAGNVYVYSLIGKLEAEISNISSPNGLAVDTAGNVYIATSGGGVLVYKNDYKTLLATLSDPYTALGVAVDKATGLVAVLNHKSNGQANVMFYRQGTTQPCVDLDVAANVLWQGAFDRDGNLYVTGEIGPPSVGVISGGCSATTLQPLNKDNLPSPYGIGVTSTGNIAIEDQYFKAIYTYKPPANGMFGNPISVTSLSGSQSVEQFAFSEGDASVFVTDSVLGRTLKYAYPAGGSPLKYIARQVSPYAVAVSSSPP